MDLLEFRREMSAIQPPREVSEVAAKAEREDGRLNPG